MKPWTRKAGSVGGERRHTCGTSRERIEKAPKVGTRSGGAGMGNVFCALQPDTGEKYGLEPTRLCCRDRLIQEHMQEIVLKGRVMDQGTMLFADKDGVGVRQGGRRHACRSRRHGAEQAGFGDRAITRFEVENIEVPSDRRIADVTWFEANLQLSALLFDHECTQSRCAIASQKCRLD